MAVFTVVYDACVLFPAPLRDLLMHLAITDLFKARWTNQIHDEWIEGVLRVRPDLTRAQLERTRKLMNENVRDCVVTGYKGLIEGLRLPDDKDRHVLAAAMHCGAGAVITFNLKHFPSSVLHPHGIEAQHPDKFICRLFELAPEIVCRAAKNHRQSLRKPPRAVNEYLETLEVQRLHATVARLRQHRALI